MVTNELSEQERLDWAERQLRKSVRMLAASPEEQVAWLTNIRTYPLLDELAMEFDDYYRLADQLVADGRLSEATLSNLAEIDRLLSQLTHGDKANWYPEALTQPGWVEVRRVAALILPSLPGPEFAP